MHIFTLFLTITGNLLDVKLAAQMAVSYISTIGRNRYSLGFLLATEHRQVCRHPGKFPCRFYM